MSANHSIRLRFVGWLHRLLNQVRQVVPDNLSGNQIKPQPDANMGFGRICTIDNGLGERQVNDAVAHEPALRDQARNQGLHSFPFYDDPVYIAYAQRLAASNHNFISHQKSPAGIIFDVSSFNQKMGGVQS